MGLVSATFYIIDTIRICSLQFGEGGGTRPQAQALGLHRADLLPVGWVGWGRTTPGTAFIAPPKIHFPFFGRLHGLQPSCFNYTTEILVPIIQGRHCTASIPAAAFVWSTQSALGRGPLV